jgi:hypothetical protein
MRWIWCGGWGHYTVSRNSSPREKEEGRRKKEKGREKREERRERSRA